MAEQKTAAPDAKQDQKQTQFTYVFGKTADINLTYTLGRQLGASKFGTALSAVHKASGKEYCAKRISKTKFPGNKAIWQSFREEVEIMAQLDHPNIIKFREVFEDDTNIYIVMDICTGGELFEHIKKKAYSERDAAEILRQIFGALAYLHKRGVAHCDLKPENFLFEAPPPAKIKMIDFGLSKYIKPRHYFSSLVGTAYYIAPEVLKGSFRESSDLWSIGVVTFVMIFGFPPFFGDKNPDIYNSVQRGFDPQVKPGYGAWFPAKLPISAVARDFIAKLLVSDPAKRLSAEEALQHPFLKGEAPSTALDTLVLEGLRSFTCRPRLRAAILKFLSDSLTDFEVDNLKKTFSAMDENKDGIITMQELKKAMEAVSGGSPVKTSEVEKIMKLVDQDGNGSLSYDEVFLAYVHRKVTAKEERLRAAFCKLDVDSDGKITLSEARTAFGQIIMSAEENKELTKMLAEADTNKDGCIDYEEFLNMMYEREVPNPNPAVPLPPHPLVARASARNLLSNLPLPSSSSSSSSSSSASSSAAPSSPAPAAAASKK